MNVLTLAYIQDARKIQHVAIQMEIMLVAVLLVMKVVTFTIVISNYLFYFLLSGFEAAQFGSGLTHFVDDQGNEGDNCTDIDECNDGSEECPTDSYCVNNPGSYDCECPTAFQSKDFNKKIINLFAMYLLILLVTIDPCPTSAKIALNNRRLLTSPNYPQDYGRGHECRWTFTVPSGSKIVMKFQSFAVFMYFFNRV